MIVQNTGGRPQWVCSTWNIHLVRHVFHVKHHAGLIRSRHNLRTHPTSHLRGMPAGTHVCTAACGRLMSRRQPPPPESRADLRSSYEREGYFPMQNLRNISPNSWSAVLRPEISSNAYSAYRSSSANRSVAPDPKVAAASR
jgi:hypothetical protein